MQLTNVSSVIDTPKKMIEKVETPILVFVWDGRMPKYRLIPLFDKKKKKVIKRRGQKRVDLSAKVKQVKCHGQGDSPMIQLPIGSLCLNNCTSQMI